ncbi:MAG: glycosyltransferase [Luteolibacter sp.]
MSTPEPRIAIVFATMNRAHTALGCLEAIARQTHAAYLVVVADNHSTDDTVRTLKSLKEFPFPLAVLELPENLGNAGGVRNAMEHAYDQGADAVWILDDDSWPRPDALGHLVKHYEPQTVVHPLQLRPQTRCLTWPFVGKGPQGERVLIEDMEFLGQAETFETEAAWTGALISKQIRHQVGPVMGELFIRGEDEEYPRRIRRAGFSFKLIAASILDHPGPRQLIHWQFRGYHLFLETGLEDWKLYYKVRNMVWLKLQESGALRAAMISAAYFFGILRIYGLSKRSIMIKAIQDGWNGRLGKLD